MGVIKHETKLPPTARHRAHSFPKWVQKNPNPPAERACTAPLTISVGAAHEAARVDLGALARREGDGEHVRGAKLARVVGDDAAARAVRDGDAVRVRVELQVALALLVVRTGRRRRWKAGERVDGRRRRRNRWRWRHKLARLWGGGKNVGLVHRDIWAKGAGAGVQSGLVCNCDERRVAPKRRL